MIIAVRAGAFLLALAAFAAASPAPAAPPFSAVTSPRRGIEFLKSRQAADGSWQKYPGITAICALGLLKNGVKPSDPALQRSARYLAGLVKPNGAIYSDQFGPAQALPNYNTALSILALHRIDPKGYASVVRRGRQFLETSQFDEGEGYRRTQHQYGGIGYGSREDNPDVSNLQNALEALKDTGHPKNAAVFQKAIIFLQRCQNRESSNDQAWAGTDGGFIYSAGGESKADEKSGGKQTSYGSMTYAGLKSYLYCGVTKNDPRVQSAWNWIRGNYSVTENPRMGDDGLYYHWHTMAKTLAVWGQPVVTDVRGRRHRWQTELAASIRRQQKADGSWSNKNPRWWEDRPELATGYALISLGYCKDTAAP